MAEPIVFAPKESPHFAAWRARIEGAGVPCTGRGIGELATDGEAAAYLLDCTGPMGGAVQAAATRAGVLSRSVALHAAPDSAEAAALRAAGVVDVLAPGAADPVARLAVAALRRVGALEAELVVRRDALKKLNAIGYALSEVTDITELLRLILAGARDLLSADSGSIYLVEEREGEPRELLFAQAQNDSVRFDFASARLPLDTRSIAGWVALRGTVQNIPDVYALGETAEYHFNPGFDRTTGYRTVSMLVIPMRDRDRVVIGVIQLMNRTHRRGQKLTTPAQFQTEVRPFDAADEDLAESLASQAAVAIESARLYAEVQALFDGFVNASVTAIEARDPTTGGHSGRVAGLSVAIAKRLTEIETPPFRDVRFNADEVTELRYAALLHDFGKIGVRERVLVKANKLYDDEFQRVVDRFGRARERLRATFGERVMAMFGSQGPEAAAQIATLAAERAAKDAALAADLEFLREVNKPYGMTPEARARLERLAIERLPDSDEALLQPEETRRLSIARGSLDESERLEIESHVTQTYRYLAKIPWTRKLRHVPVIAYAHHEKLDGTGYPRRLKGADIPLQSKIMTIADIFDALTASDRPYKKAMPAEKALAILHEEAGKGLVDRDILACFAAERLWSGVLPNA